MTTLTHTDVKNAIWFTRKIDPLRKQISDLDRAILNFKLPRTEAEYLQRAEMNATMAGLHFELDHILRKLVGEACEYDLQPNAADAAEEAGRLGHWYTRQENADRDVAERLAA